MAKRSSYLCCMFVSVSLCHRNKSISDKCICFNDYNCVFSTDIGVKYKCMMLITMKIIWQQLITMGIHELYSLE